MRRGMILPRSEVNLFSPPGILPVDGRLLDAELADLPLEECLVTTPSALETAAIATVSPVAAAAAETAFARNPPSRRNPPGSAISLGTVPLRPISLRTVALGSISLGVSPSVPFGCPRGRSKRS